jgi:hypothetical protein
MNEMRYLPSNTRFKKGSGNWRVWEWFAIYGQIDTKTIHRVIGCDMSRVADCKREMAQYGFTLPKGGIRIAEGNYSFPMIEKENDEW